MSFKRILEELNISAKCRQYKLPAWRCPQFLFLIMGTMIGVTAFVTYTLGTRYYIAEPNTVSLIVLALTTILLIITFSIVRSMEGLAEANHLKSEFINIISHQLRSPLSNMKWATDALCSDKFGKINGKQGEYMKIIFENNNRMGELISDLLMVSRIEGGKLILNNIQFSLADLAKEVINGLSPLAAASNIEVRIEAPEFLPQTFGDPKMIKMVVENLLDNAIRYAKEKGEIFIKLEKKNSHLLFEIHDNGVGIPKEDQGHIFQSFFRSRNALRYQTQGSGLGLHIAKSIVEKSGGKIWFKSREGEGTTFWFTLPTK